MESLGRRFDDLYEIISHAVDHAKTAGCDDSGADLDTLAVQLGGLEALSAPGGPVDQLRLYSADLEAAGGGVVEKHGDLCRRLEGTKDVLRFRKDRLADFQRLMDGLSVELDDVEEALKAACRPPNRGEANLQTSATAEKSSEKKGKRKKHKKAGAEDVSPTTPVMDVDVNTLPRSPVADGQTIEVRSCFHAAVFHSEFSHLLNFGQN